MEYKDLYEGATFYTATGKWVVTDMLPNDEWNARMIWKRDGYDISIDPAECVGFDRYDLGGCDIEDRFSE